MAKNWEGAIEGAVVGSFSMLGRTLKVASVGFKVSHRLTIFKNLYWAKTNLAGAARIFQIPVSAMIGIAKNINGAVNWGNSEFERFRRRK